MQLSPALAQVQSALLAAAALGDERTREVAAGLADAAAPAVRLAVLDAVYAAADEITAALLDHPGAPVVDVRPDPVGGDEVHVGVRTTASAAPPGDGRADDGDASARVSLRLSEKLKADVEQAAAKDGLSVNAWLVRAASTALEPSPFAGFGNLGDLGARLGRMGGFGRGFGGPGGGPGGFGGGLGGGFGGGGFGGEPGGDRPDTRPDDRRHITGWIDG